MENVITYNKHPYDKMKMVDLENESEEMKWAILDYHNQDFVLNGIVNNTPFTPEGHADFLAKYPYMRRRQYIVYYNNRAIGKISVTPISDDEYDDLGCYLFHKEDLHKRLGMLVMSFAYHYLFDVRKAKKIKYDIRKINKNSQRISISLGCKIISENNDRFNMECSYDDYKKRISNIDGELAEFFAADANVISL